MSLRMPELTRTQFFVALAGLAGVALGQEAPSARTMGSPLADPRVRRIGLRLKCQCGCEHSVTECDMLRCHFCDPNRVKIQQMVDAGSSDQQVLDVFVKEYGLKVLQAPPTEGFYFLGWAMPAVGLASFTAITVAIIGKLRKQKLPPPAPEVAPKPDQRVVSEYEQMIDKELDQL